MNEYQFTVIDKRKVKLYVWRKGRNCIETMQELRKWCILNGYAFDRYISKRSCK